MTDKPKDDPTQETPAGHTIPVPTREDVFRDKLKEAHLLRIEAQNPGIDMDEVRRHCCE